MEHTTRCRVILLAALLLQAAAAPSTAGELAVDVAAAHAGTACNACHLRGRETGTGSPAAAERRCAACHDARPSTRGPFHREKRQDCLSCHSYHDPGALAIAGGRLDLASMRGVSAAHCQSCHAGPGPSAISPSHVAAARHYHGDIGTLAGQGPSAGCLNCHAREVPSSWQVSADDRSRDFYLHASHPQGVRVLPGSGRGAARMRSVIDPAIPLFAGRIECQTCHLLTADTRYHLVPFDRKDGLCLGCHRVGPESAATGAAVASLVSSP